MEGKFEKPQYSKPAKKLKNNKNNEKNLGRKRETVMFVENLVTMLMNASSVRVEMETLVIITVIIVRTETTRTIERHKQFCKKLM